MTLGSSDQDAEGAHPKKLERFFFANALLGIWCVVPFWKEKFGRFSNIFTGLVMIARIEALKLGPRNCRA